MNNGFTRDELKLLIKKYKHSKISIGLKRKIAKVIDRELLDDEDTFTSSLKLIARNQLINMGYHNNTLFLKESECIINKLKDELSFLYGQKCNQETIAYSIVSEILNYYNSNYDKEYYLKFFDIPLDKYLYSETYIHELCAGYYWQPRITIQ